jgi:dCTP deaminase
VLPSQHLADAIEARVIHGSGADIPEANVQPASLDLRLGDTAFSVRCSFLPAGRKVLQRVNELKLAEMSLRGDGVVLETGRPYLIPLKEELRLPPEVRARANPKSSTGRADVFTRVITDNGARFDDIAPGYHGQLFLEVVPLSFPVRVREDLSLNQLRLSVGTGQLSDQDIQRLHESIPLLYVNGSSVDPEHLRLAGGLFLGLDLRGDRHGHVGYKSLPNAPLLDLSRVGVADPGRFWESVTSETGRRIVLNPKSFYLLMSREAVVIPPSLAAEMTAYDPTSGELRTHYAGFFDPGFGFDPKGELRGSTAALEVRAHDVPFMIEHGQPVCKLTFEPMLAEPTRLYGNGIGSNYQGQHETLGKHFRRPVSTKQPSTPDDDQLGLFADPAASKSSPHPAE